MTAYNFITCPHTEGGWAILADGKVMPLFCATQEQAQAIIRRVIDYHASRAKAAPPCEHRPARS